MAPAPGKGRLYNTAVSSISWIMQPWLCISVLGESELMEYPIDSLKEHWRLRVQGRVSSISWIMQPWLGISILGESELMEYPIDYL